MSYASYAASIEVESPFRLYSQTSFSSDLKIGAEKPTQQLFQCQQLFQSQQQQSQRQHLTQQLMSSKLQQHGSQQLQRFRIKWPLVLGALLVAVFVAAALMFTPLGWPVLPHTAHTTAPSAGVINCRIQAGSSSFSTLCDGDLVQYQDGRQAHITVWSQGSAAAGLDQPGSAGGAVEDGGAASAAADRAWDAVYGRHRRRQQHRKLVRFA